MKNLLDFKLIEIDPPADEVNVQSFMIVTNSEIDLFCLIINIYNKSEFAIFFDSSPLPLKGHSSVQKRNIETSSNPVLLPLSKLDRDEINDIVASLINGAYC